MMKRRSAQEREQHTRDFISDRTMLRDWSDAELAEAVDAVHAAPPSDMRVQVTFCARPITVAAIAE